MSRDHTARPAKAPEDEVRVLWKRGRGGDLVFCSEAWRSCPLPRPIPVGRVRVKPGTRRRSLRPGSSVAHTRARTPPNCPSRSGTLACFLCGSFELFKSRYPQRVEPGWAKQAGKQSHSPNMFSILTQTQEKPVHICVVVIGENFLLQDAHITQLNHHQGPGDERE